MKRVLMLVVASLIFTLGVICQDLTSVSTSTVDGARFEVLQSPIDRAVFRLDKYAGVIDRLGNCPKDDGYGSKLCWKEMIVLDLSKSGSTGKPRYQIIINGTLRLTMLLQINTGRMWQYGIDPQERWFPFIDCSDKTNSNCLWRP